MNYVDYFAESVGIKERKKRRRRTESNSDNSLDSGDESPDDSDPPPLDINENIYKFSDNMEKMLKEMYFIPKDIENVLKLYYRFTPDIPKIRGNRYRKGFHVGEEYFISSPKRITMYIPKWMTPHAIALDIALTKQLSKEQYDELTKNMEILEKKLVHLPIGDSFPYLTDLYKCLNKKIPEAELRIYSVLSSPILRLKNDFEISFKALHMGKIRESYTDLVPISTRELIEKLKEIKGERGGKSTKFKTKKIREKRKRKKTKKK